MKLFMSLTLIIAAVSASQIYTPQMKQYISPQAEEYANQQAQNYAHSAEMYQSVLEQQQQEMYSGQSASYPANVQHHSKPHAEKTPRIISYNSENNGHNYHYSFETDNGISAQELGGDQGKGAEVHGAYSYVGDDGHVYTVEYVADENGFRPKGEHLPTPPPVPEAILKSLEQNAKDEAAGIYDKGGYVEATYRHQQKPQNQHYEIQVPSDSAYHYINKD